MIELKVKGDDIEFDISGTEDELIDEVVSLVDSLITEIAEKSSDSKFIQEYKYGRYARCIVDNIEQFVKDGFPE